MYYLKQNIKSCSKRMIILGFFLLLSVIYQSPLFAEQRTGLLLNADLTVDNDDNVLRNVKAIDDSSVKISPDFQFSSHLGNHLLSINYLGMYTLYKENSDLSYENHDLSALLFLDHSYKLNSEFILSYQDEIEEPGLNNSASILIKEFNQINNKRAQAKIFYGEKESTGQLVFAAEYKEYRYTNNLQNFRDNNFSRFSSTFFYRIAPKTRLLFQATLADYNYLKKDQLQDQSSNELFYLTGVEWELTAQTSGTFKIGYQSKEFEQGSSNDFSGLSYLLSMVWKPSTFTKVNIGASQQSKESSQLFASAFLTTRYSISAEHELSPRTNIKASYALDNDDITSTQNRTDTRNDLNLSISHSLLTWLDVSLNYRLLERKSDLSLYEFKSNTIGLSLTTKFE